jgi:hypothetical protein
MIQANGGHARASETLRDLDAAVAGYDAVCGVNQTGLLNPKLRIEAAIWAICLSE